LDQLELKNQRLSPESYQQLKIFRMLRQNFGGYQKRIKKQHNSSIGNLGTGGSGKSSLVDELVRRFLIDFPEKPSD
jgi:methylmalonyl-CoA mutase